MFQYNSTDTNILCTIIKKKTGLNVSEYLKPRLFDKIGMTNISCQLLPGITNKEELEESGSYEQFKHLNVELAIPGLWNVRNRAHENE